MIYTDHDRYTEYIKGNFENYAIWISDALLQSNGALSKIGRSGSIVIVDMYPEYQSL